MKKKFVSIVLAAGVIATPVVTTTAVYASQNNKNSTYEININSTKIKKATISGISFSYKNAPASVKSAYLKDARTLGVQVTNNSNIFIPDFDVSKYNLSKDDLQKSAVESWTIEDYGSYFISTQIYTGRQYTVSKSTLVGYNHVTSGNPVHLTQLFLNIFAYKYPGHNSVAVDSIFGPNTQQAVLSFQQFAGLSNDATVGPNTWNAFSSYCLN
ncbi:peptidoglycan-binding domain-containing protein [Clostridium tyrobutyricum]|uniref:peptidoglycan-binding domain-containing protein n=1 Tax=Clostridium tyrobutyricum TaxID=1519 RepID=UPI00073DB05B|nr:peptidoglycan-binding domain-containing protein [Clostridium tyrobutyricum]